MAERKRGASTKEKVIEELSNIYDVLHDPDKLRETAEERVSQLVDIMSYGFDPGQKFSFEQIYYLEAPSPFEVDGVNVWRNMDEEYKETVLEEIGDFFGVDLINVENIPVTKVVSENVTATTKQEQVDVRIVHTNNPLIDIWVIDYEEERFDRGYALVRAEEE